MAKVAIVTASYNYADYIKETIESVLAQSFQDWEMIIVDDGSSDNSVEVIKSYCIKDKRIKLFCHKNNKNLGLGPTLRLGVEKAQAEWLVFLESDDTITPDYIEQKLKVVSENPDVDCIFNSVNMFGDPDIIDWYDNIYFTKTLPVINKLEYPTEMFSAFRESIDDNIIPTFSAVMIKKTIMKNLSYNSPFKPYLDWYLWLQIVSGTKCKFFYLDKKLTNWRMHSKSYISTIMKEKERLKFEKEKARLLHISRKNISFPTLFSKEVVNNRTKYKILGVKISVKNKRHKNSLKYQSDLVLKRRTIRQQICDSSVEYVSFDIFDTLLVRPCIFPTDIFALIATKFDTKYNIDFLSMRFESQKGRINANIYDIYETMQKKYNLTSELKNQLMQEEIALEKQLLSVREDVKLFYDLAVKHNKKIIAISDMYLPSDVLKDILVSKGFDKISKVYVSNEYDARKDYGSLYKVVLNDIKTRNLIHIGDNFKSDYKIPLSMGLKAYHYPKVLDILASKSNILEKLIYGANQKNIISFNKNIFCGYVLNNYWFNSYKNNKKMLNTLKDFANLFLGPYLYYIAFMLQRNAIIQSLYDKIYFIARDGYLPCKIYNIMNDGKYIVGEYVYGSRVAYWTGSYDSIYELIKSQAPSVSKDFTLKDFIDSYITDKTVNSDLIGKYSEEELSVCVNKNLQLCQKLLKREDKILTEYYNNQRNLSKMYYENIFKSEKNRVAVFDVGYSGSLSLGLNKLVPKIFDKIYIHETETNVYRDNQYKSHTYVLKNGIYSNYLKELDLLLEESWSPLEGSCIGFYSDGTMSKPLLEKITVSNKMKLAHKQLHETSENFIKGFITQFGSYRQYLNITDMNSIMAAIVHCFMQDPKSKELFKDITFKDRATLHVQKSLSSKF